MKRLLKLTLIINIVVGVVLGLLFSALDLIPNEGIKRIVAIVLIFIFVIFHLKSSNEIINIFGRLKLLLDKNYFITIIMILFTPASMVATALIFQSNVELILFTVSYALFQSASFTYSYVKGSSKKGLTVEIAKGVQFGDFSKQN